MSLLFRQFRAELHKLFARKRTYIGFGAFLSIELVVLLLFQIPKVQRGFRAVMESNGYGFEKYYSGLTLGFILLFSTVFLLASLYLALVAGDVISKEVEEGTMRMMLCRPISRGRIVAIKYAACLVYTLVLVNFIGVTSLAAGCLRQGWGGGLFAYVPPENLFAIYDFGPGLYRYFLSLQLLALSLSTVTSLAFLFSCCDMKPAAATIITLSYIFVDGIFRGLPYFESIRIWLLTTHMSAWYAPFHDPFPLWSTLEHYAYLMGANATFVAVGYLIFAERDLKS